jgi:hypothetical protein
MIRALETIARAAPRVLLAGALILTGCSRSDDIDGDGAHKVNGTVHIVAGMAPGSAETVNGSVYIDDNAAVTAATTVNGGIRLGAHSTADTLNTVNGNITVGAGAHVAKAAEAVNGGVNLRDGADVSGSVVNVNGKIEVTGAHIGGGIKTVGGDIMIFGNSRVDGGIFVQKPGGLIHFFGHEVPRIAIGPGATVQGDLRFEREVKLYVSDKATIGPVTGATPIPFSGDTPPAG